MITGAAARGFTWRIASPSVQCHHALATKRTREMPLYQQIQSWRPIYMAAPGRLERLRRRTAVDRAAGIAHESERTQGVPRFQLLSFCLFASAGPAAAEQAGDPRLGQ